MFEKLDQFALLRIVCVMLLTLLVGLIVWMFLPRPQQQTAPPTIRILETEIVQVTRTGTQTEILEVETGRQHIFELVTTTHRRGQAPTQRQRTAVDNDTVRILTYRAALVIYEVQTGAIHII